MLQWYESNATSATDEVITHTYIEEVCFLDGSMMDVTLGEEWGKGAYAYRLPGTKHDLYKAGGKGVVHFAKCVGVGE